MSLKDIIFGVAFELHKKNGQDFNIPKITADYTIMYANKIKEGYNNKKADDYVTVHIQKEIIKGKYNKK